MKNFYLFTIVLFSIVSNAQELPSNFFDTWYPIEILASEGYPSAIIVADIEPTIAPYLTINEDLTFYGMMACNEYSGNLAWNPEGFYHIDNFSITDLNCDNEEHTNFEIFYTVYLQTCMWYPIITQVENGLSMSMEAYIFGYGIFNNYMLSVGELSQNSRIQIYPNPVTDKLHLNGLESGSNVEIYTTVGKLVKKISGNISVIDVNGLAKGIYFVRITNNEDVMNLKFIKK